MVRRGDLLLTDCRGLELQVFGLQVGIRLAENVVACLRVVEHLLQVFDPLVFALPIGSLGGAVLCSTAR